MRYLNIYPKRLWAALNSEGVFEGHLRFDLEQYGLVTNDVACDVTISEHPLILGKWKIWVKPMHDVEMPHFDKLVETINQYVFDVLHYKPSRSASGKDLPMVKLFFDDIYIDMSGAEPVVQKISVKSTQKK